MYLLFTAKSLVLRTESGTCEWSSNIYWMNKGKNVRLLYERLYQQSLHRNSIALLCNGTVMDVSRTSPNRQWYNVGAYLFKLVPGFLKWNVHSPGCWYIVSSHHSSFPCHPYCWFFIQMLRVKTVWHGRKTFISLLPCSRPYKTFESQLYQLKLWA